MTTERDELADLAWSIEGYTGLSAYAARSLARDLQDAGYRKPRTVTTAAELDALPHGAVLLTSDHTDTALLKDGDLFRNQSGAEITTGILLRFGTQPFTVLHEATR